MSARGPNIAVIGGGINGVMTAWSLAERGCQVTLFDRGTVMGETSRASTKLLHGGLRYLEHGAFRLVRESLHERTWWVQHAPEWAHPIRLFLPVAQRGTVSNARPRWLLGLGLTLYDMLAGRHTFGHHHWHTTQDVAAALPHLRTETITGAYSFFDVQMDDHALGMWAAERARDAGVHVHEYTTVERVSTDGHLVCGDILRYDSIVNVAGPWAEQLLTESGIPAQHTLDLVRGSHLVLRGTISAGVMIQVPREQRICFVLPYGEHMLLGTTEVRHTLGEPITCSSMEQQYLLDVYNAAFTDTRTNADIVSTFAGIRPLLRSADDPTRASREYAIERNDRLVTVFGGKWTTAHALGHRAARVAEAAARR